MSKLEKARDLVELGQFYILNRKYSEAIKELKAALKLVPASVDAFFNLGLAYEGSHKLEQAREAFCCTLKLSPQHKEASEHLSRLIDER